MADDSASTAYSIVTNLLHELQSVSPAGCSATLDRALDAMREAVSVWGSRIEQLAVHDQARNDAATVERRARDQVCLLLDLVMQISSAPNPPPDVRCRPSHVTHGPTSTDDSPAETPPAPTPRTALAVYLLGAFEVRVAGGRLTSWRGRRGPAVLQFLISRRGGPVEREALTEALWPEISPGLGRHRIHQAVYALRQTLHQLDPGREHIICEDGAYRINPRVSLWTDVAEFERLTVLAEQHDGANRRDDALDAYRRAEALYRGDYLEGTALAAWAESERNRLRANFVRVGNRLSEIFLDRGNCTAALAVCRKVLERDGWNEELTQRAMRCYVATGNPSLAMKLFKSFETELDNELGLEPSPETRRLFKSLRFSAP